MVVDFRSQNEEEASETKVYRIWINTSSGKQKWILK